MTDLTKLLSDSSVSAQQAAEKLASPCLEAIKKNEDASKIEGEFDSLWSSVLSAAEQTPHDKQGKLVETLHAIKSIPQSAETVKKVVVWGEEKRWDELPMFGGKAREQLDIAQEKSDEAFVNINGFFARATAARVDDLSLFAIWTLREALEVPAADKISETSPKLLKASSVWFIYAVDALAKASEDGKQFDGKVAKPGASLMELKDEAGWRGFNNDRWKVWLDRLSTLKEGDVPEDTKSLVVQALNTIREASGLKADIRLAQAVSEFEAELTTEQKVAFRASRTAATSTAPTMSDVMRLTAEMDLKATSKHGRIRCFGPRLTNMLQAIQQFAALGDIVVGGSQNLIACGVWSVARMTVHVITGYLTHLEKLSVLFMAVGRNAPRYQAMAAIYPKSKNLQRYLCEYFIVVTKICHQTIQWAQKSAVGRLSSSIRDPDMKGFQADLDTWSASIKEEADLLLSQGLQDEAKENATFRSIVSSRSKYLQHRQKINESIRFLDACSQHDYRTTWKQTRKRGTTRILPSYTQYQKWKNSQTASDSILFRGKLGAGKSVLLANIVDDLNLLQNSITLYFFAHHDNPDSLSSRIIFGSLVRQLLEVFVYDSKFEHIFSESVSRLDSDDIVKILATMPSHDRHVYIVIDGLDECSKEEQQTVLLSLSAIKAEGYKICISVRTPTESSVWKDQSFEFHESIPEENQDIFDFVQVEVDNRVRNERLVTLDPLLVQDIKQELIDGACGMFLWVSLQLDSICSEISDTAIREAIRDLPRDLTQTYERNLLKASSDDSKGHHIRIFKLLVGAREPLTAEQLREAVSVKVGQTTWSPQQHISSIHAALRFCGSLVMVDEEDDTVTFIHHSARSFCLNSPRNAAEWTFTEREANLDIAETLVTYLSYDIFDTRLSRNVAPRISANKMPETVALSTLSNRQVGQSVANKFFRLKSKLKRDIGPTLARVSTGHQVNNTHQFLLLPYAKNNWIRHSSHLESLPSLPNWYHLLDHPEFGIDFDDYHEAARKFHHIVFHRSVSLSPNSLPILPSQTTLWAVSNGHILLLKYELTRGRGLRKLQAFVELWVLLMRLSQNDTLKQLDYHLVKWLCLLLIRLGTKSPIKSRLLSRLSAFDNCFVDYAGEAIRSSDAEAFSFFLGRFTIEDAQHFKNNTKLIEWAIASGSVDMLRLLIRFGLAKDSLINGRAVSQASRLNFPDELKSRLVYYLFGAGFDFDALTEDELYKGLKLFCAYVSLEEASRIVRGLFSLQRRKTGPKADILLGMACTSGDYEVAEALLSCLANPNATTPSGRSCLDMALHSPSPDRVRLIWKLVKSGAQATTNTVDRAFELRYWGLALHFLAKHGPHGSHYSYSVTTGDSPTIIDSFLIGTLPRNEAHIHIVQPCQLPIVETSDWTQWQFSFGPPKAKDGYRGTVDARDSYHLTKYIHSRFALIKTQSGVLSNDQGRRFSALLCPGMPSFHVDLEHWERDQMACLKLTTPSSFVVIAEINRRWQSASDSLVLLDTDENSIMINDYESCSPIWDRMGRSDGRGRWVLPDSFWDAPKVRQLVERRRSLAHVQLDAVHWGLKILGKSLSLFLNLPSQSTLDTFDPVFPPLHIPIKPHGRLRFPAGFPSDLAYVSLRIQLIRTLRAMSNKGLLAKVVMPAEVLTEIGVMMELLPAFADMDEDTKAALHHEGVIPEVLEAAFLGPEGKRILRRLIKQNTQWRLQVSSWVRRMDTSIFMWSMGENAPLSFTRAFESLRAVGVSDGDIEMLERSLDFARAKLLELE
ncbi:heterokaryon incompatibility protein het-E-1 [Fusarium globosum]|uniref:Heterokaryon incompatibility protein het-E-1 n=1 Tax=Fusarium globosum TaxID=78864 RepID=A0A8H5Z1A3_9HYPO|nr:heterokaryon incompatibility protein het-E-1 [Fusarium globosum]